MSDPAKSRSSCRVFLAIVDSSLTPHQISELLNLEPDRALEIGRPTPTNPNKMSEINRWEVRIPVDEQLSLEHHLESLLRLIGPMSSRIRQLAQQASVRIEVDIDYPEFAVSRGQAVEGIYIAREVMSAIASIAGELDIDISV